MAVNTVKDSAFSGKISGCYYADGSRIIVAADKLYLYDTGKGETIASADISVGDLCVQTFTDGYFVVGQGKAGGGGSNGSFATAESSGINGYILNKDFAVQNSNSAYFMCVPHILILDESGTCIVVLGRGIDEVSTLITTFGFVG